jgi:hypothetical protein
MHRSTGSTRLVAAALVTLTLALAGCGDDDAETAATDSAPPAASDAPNTTSAPSPTVTQEPATSAAPATTEAPTTVPGPIVIEVDGDAGAPATPTVPLGADVELVVTSAEEQEFHLHGYDLEQEGTRVTFVFTASQAGTFELERHRDGGVVLLLTVA